MLLHLRASFLLCERTQKHWNIIVSSHPFFPHHHVALGPLYRLRTSKMCVYKFGHHLRVLQGESEKISYDSCYVVFSALASADPISEILPILLSGSSGHKNFPQYHIYNPAQFGGSVGRITENYKTKEAKCFSLWYLAKVPVTPKPVCATKHGLNAKSMVGQS